MIIITIKQSTGDTNQFNKGKFFFEIAIHCSEVDCGDDGPTL